MTSRRRRLGWVFWRALRHILLASFAGAILLTAVLRISRADQPPSENGDRLPMPTMGGKQFWADELFFHQWRIQRNVLTGSYRLLDEDNLRHASGSFSECRAVLDNIIQQRRLPAMQGRAVVVLHGLGRSRSSMNKLCGYMREKGGYVVLNVSYPSTQSSIDTHAAALGRIIENLDGIDEISFVAHSMGNIVIRRYLGEQASRTGGRDPRIRRFVMLAPPNHGSVVALTLADNLLFKAVTGQSGQQLGRDWNTLTEKLATPDFLFGILAGGRGSEKGMSPLLPGDNDGTISVATTRLAGAADFMIVPVAHTFIMDDENVMRFTLRFLQEGCFRSRELRHPLRNGNEW